MRWCGVCAVLVLIPGLCPADGATASGGDAARGRAALLGRAFVPPSWSRRAYDNLWRRWGLKEKPADYDRLVRERYGLHLAPYENGGYPMGFREAAAWYGKGLTNDCMICHGGSVAGKSFVGLSNASLDLESLYGDLFAANGTSTLPPKITLCNVRGTTEAFGLTLVFLRLRDAELNLRPPADLEIPGDLCQDSPAWWLLKRKKTMSVTGSVDSRSVRTIMQFMVPPTNTGEFIKQQEPVFADIQAYILSLQAPKYPFAIDEPRAVRGKELFGEHCASCHGAYGPQGNYPNRILSVEAVGTDPNRARGMSPKAKTVYEQSWFAKEGAWTGSYFVSGGKTGYQAPPLDGVWATAPYFHNGSVPTVYHVLNSKARPRIFTRSFRTEVEDYDQKRLGWKITVLECGPDPGAPSFERRKVYDTTLPGRGNAGHTFGDQLTEEERLAVIEYLKTL